MAHWRDQHPRNHSRHRDERSGYGEASGNYGDDRSQQYAGRSEHEGANYPGYALRSTWGRDDRGAAHQMEGGPGAAAWGMPMPYYQPLPPDAWDEFAHPSDQRAGDYGRTRGYSGDRPRHSGDYGHGRGFLDKAGDEVASWFGDDAAQARREQDHRGRGPRNYQRSDARIEEDVNDRLTDDPLVDASEISCTVQDREVTLDGFVDSRAAKRRAEDCADSVSGVTHVQNNLRVKTPGATSAARA